MATCYRHPSRETGVSCSNCGRPICPDCMTTTPVGMRCPECSRSKTVVKRMRDIARRARGHLRADRDQRDRLPRRGQPHVRPASRAARSMKRRSDRELSRAAGHGVAHGQWWRLVTGGFLHENLLHIGFNMYILYILGMMLEPAIGRLQVRRDLLHLAAGGLVRARCSSRPTRRRWAPPGRCSA